MRESFGKATPAGFSRNLDRKNGMIFIQSEFNSDWIKRKMIEQKEEEKNAFIPMLNFDPKARKSPFRCHLEKFCRKLFSFLMNSKENLLGACFDVCRLLFNAGWIASTYQRDTEPRDYQECSQVDEPRVRGMPIPRGCLTKSELIRDFKIRADHTALFGAPEPETQFETPNAVSPSVPVLSSNLPFYSPPQVMELRPPFTPLDDRTPG
ncbi:hypothetical protein AVEN_106458-1 [Araneus ventricosus]|uniref:Uncharacterized protein n=1 Tax=Araneus ventricosus TaxID=182803 RepID=A0A4Y2ASK1_ARAVE|nr:hypothetical protein AVEN_106458-1 [Araneus ventricosus]